MRSVQSWPISDRAVSAESLIHLRVPAATKARWVRESRAAGMRLTDWLVSRIDPMPQITIPPGLSFAALKLSRDASGSVSFDLAVITAIEQASGLADGFLMSQPEDVLGEVIVRWYDAHIAAGGERDPVADDLIAEVRIEDERGGGISHQPGRA